MEKKVYNTGIIGCGDYLRLQSWSLKRSARLKVTSLFDPNTAAAQKYAAEFGARAVHSADDIFNDPSIGVVGLFTPPWLRREYALKAAQAKKHVVTTKPLAPTAEECADIVRAARSAGINFSVFYRRTEAPVFSSLKKVLDSGEVGSLMLFKEDWFHHYPQWNTWATDPQKNGGPFMDAMIHNLNLARYLIGSEVVSYSFFSDNCAQCLKCNDTEALKVDFANGARAYLFITWAGDLKVFDLTCNEREHLDLHQMITDKGWFIRLENRDGKQVITASKEQEVRVFEVQRPVMTAYDEFITLMEEGKKQKYDVTDAWKDVKIITEAMKHKNVMQPIDFNL